ncbi:hypothetical protein VCRA2119O147_680007 [Vibrio crassostreae]|uniref:HNH endonuclease n=1 Tax=Vibrio crassostreae TaxID=246167 RepID=UPI0005E480E7|nr:HNH endonuclease [Vibrio crassostreae]TCT62601.1 hypothetical protein EDB44_10825 [Vibrio crassostreae]TCT83361.1 hypothetical protein EDB43_10826 [Vibrio crassostreae]TCU03772.1 hypothetical protein EDB47_10926 [Vibrio crassostreae]TDW09511.1 hypothetical protein EDB45_10725 [Vibrio crassostreae]CAK2048834.1 hypothetical protein VCRA2112O187_30010 [Vibrio crassostreae]
MKIRIRGNFGKHKGDVTIKADESGEIRAYVSLGKRKITRVDPCDLTIIAQHNFTYHKRNDGKFVAKCTCCKKYLHRLIIQARDGTEVDHINAEPLDNTRGNLRPCSPKQNHLARKQKQVEGFWGIKKIREGSIETSRYKQVIIHPLYAAINASNRLVGRYRTPQEAAIERDKLMKSAYDVPIRENEVFHNFAFIKWNPLMELDNGGYIELDTPPEEAEKFYEWQAEQINNARADSYVIQEELFGDK